MNHNMWSTYRSADKSLARPERKQTRKHVREANDFNNIETRVVVKFFFSLQGKAPKEIHAILTETLACFLPGRAKGLSAPLCITLMKKRLALVWYIRGVGNIRISWSTKILIIIIIIIIIIISFMQDILILLRQTMSLGNIVLQLFYCYYSWCLYR